ncbi:Serpentine Receptor, class BC (Class B-like) [Caenorhabditis elegans]|uniref:Serpentine Receptor, class BC (Class B-like) n=1 Tax=Caenorhabditis elegans TaxID=6239 RepID=Q5F4V5_CAEEL|nr:Serpentine Receptor, class BC (Class B-like) [Caenorhabditis elegans]CCD62481.1 Serpentine Receptor, class BC (Class B-like) [Caenorhabditis elegans]|eukprot:NP_503973.2 Serpentine Receptor, class BC (class B-like) [Caenorhabditis elegans]
MDIIITVVCLLGAVSSLVTIVLNGNLVWKIVLKKSKRNDDLQLFYYRFTMDICFSTCLLVYIIFVILTMEVPHLFSNHRGLIVTLGLPWSNFATCRSAIALAISLERLIAAYFPIRYRTARNKIPNFSIFSMAVAFALSEELVLFGFCSYSFDIPPNCRAFGCAVNQCFYNFWTAHRTIIFAIILVSSILLSVKLFVWNNSKGKQSSKHLSKTNRLALLNTCTVFIFDFVPSFFGTMWPTAPMFNFDLVGPYNAVSKITGCAIDSFLVSRLLLKKDHGVAASTVTTILQKVSRNSSL